MDGLKSTVWSTGLKFVTATESLFLQRLKPFILPDATVYVDEVSACLWNHSLLQGGLLRFLKEGKAHSIRSLTSNLPSPILRPDTTKKVFVISVHLSKSVEMISEIINSSPTSLVYILSCTPFRLPSSTTASPLTASYLEDPISELQHRFPTIDIQKEYLPMTWAMFIPNCLVVPPFVSIVQEEEKILGLAKSLFGLVQAIDATPTVWTLGSVAKQVGQTLKQIWHTLDADGYAQKDVSLVIVDRLSDITPFLLYKSRPTSVLSSIFNQGLLPSTSLSVLEGPNHSIPFSHHGHPTVLEWLQLLIDFPEDGVSILRKKSMDLGTKIRILGKPSSSQFLKILTSLKENKSIVKEHMEALLFLSLVIKALEGSTVSPWHMQVAELQSSFETLPKDEQVNTLLRFIQTAPSIDDAIKLGLWGYFQTESDRLVFSIAPKLPINLDLNELSSSDGLIPHAIHACFTESGELDYLDFGLQKTAGFMRFLAGRPKPLLDSKCILVCITGAVSIEELTLFRKLTKQWATDPQKEMYLVSTSIENGISFF